MASRSSIPASEPRNGSVPNALAPALPLRSANRRPPNPPYHELDDFRPPNARQLEADSSSDDGITTSKHSRSRSRKPQHSRSMSHPFPSLFAPKTKTPPLHDDSTADRGPKTGHANLHANMAPRNLPRGNADFANGNCMTCGGLVRWPRELTVFRCTICLTINDLKPHTPKAGTEADRFMGNRRKLSLQHTRNLIRESVRFSLRAFMALNGHDVTPSVWPCRSSSRESDDYFSQSGSMARHVRFPSTSGTPSIPEHPPVFDDAVNEDFEPNLLNRSASARSHSTPYPGSQSVLTPSIPQPKGLESLDPRRIFKPVEDYLIASFEYVENINTSFVTASQSFGSRGPIQIKRKPVPMPEPRIEKPRVYEETLVSELDAKLLLLGDFAENAGWWTGGQQDAIPARSLSQPKDDAHSLVTSRSPRIDWGEVLEWYHIIINAAATWTEVYDEEVEKNSSRSLSPAELQQFEASVLEAQNRLQRTLLKCTEMLLKRPGRLLKEPQDVRFLLILLVNPLLGPEHKSYSGLYQTPDKEAGATTDLVSRHEETPSMGRHSGLIKRLLGLLSNSSDQCHHNLVVWFSRLPEHLFLSVKDIISTFVTYRLRRQSEKKIETKVDVTAGLIPQMPNNRSGNTPASLHAALHRPSEAKKQNRGAESLRISYSDDWQIKAGAKIMALIFAANSLTHVRRNEMSVKHAHGHLLATSDFYNTMLDCLDFKTDFEMWESRRGKFAFCQYPFFLSIWAKIKILEFDAKRQMAGKAREAFFDSILTNKSYAQHLVLRVRRDCLVEDSLTKVSEVIGSGSEDIKKRLRIEFQGEEGVDAGGLRKEWFLLLVREVFNPDHGLFVFDEDSQCCYFNPHTFETSDQYFLVGVVLGLAIYNSTILDVALPPFAFRKLLAAAPVASSGASSHHRPTMTYTLGELTEYRPRLASGLRQLLDFEGDVESTFCLDFVIEVEKYGTRIRVPLCPGGESKPVNNSNRREYVDLYVRYLLDTSVSRQFEPFKRGFFTICAGNALSLFRPEEIELLVRGSDEPLDINSLRGVAQYTNWSKHAGDELEPESEPTIEWFWDTFRTAPPTDQRRLLSFITGSDRIPAMGATSLVIKINCLGSDTGRYPTARTCFNMLNLYRYQSQSRLETTLWTAVHESEGFGLR